MGHVMRTLALLLLAWPAFAQVPPSKTTALIPQTNDACAEGATPGGTPQYGLVAGNRIAYCTTQLTVDAAAALSIAVSIDGVSMGAQLPTLCALNGRKVAQCYLVVTRAMLLAVAPPGQHKVTLVDVTSGAGYEDMTIATGCPAMDVSVSPWVTLPTYVAVGTSFGQVNQMLVSSFFASKARAEAAGYAVEWSVQFFANSSVTADRRLVVGGRCIGVPQ